MRTGSRWFGEGLLSLIVLSQAISACVEPKFFVCDSGTPVVVDGVPRCDGALDGGMEGGTDGGTGYFTTTGCGPTVARTACNPSTGAPCPGQCWEWVGGTHYCRTDCVTNDDCTSTVGPNSFCMQQTDPDMGTPRFACTIPCSPFEANTCPSGQTCSLFPDPFTGNGRFAECRPTGAAPELSACATFEATCAPGLSCAYLSSGAYAQNQGHYCVRHCRPGFDQDCPSGFVCGVGAAHGLFCSDTIQAATCVPEEL